MIDAKSALSTITPQSRLPTPSSGKDDSFQLPEPIHTYVESTTATLECMYWYGDDDDEVNCMTSMPAFSNSHAMPRLCEVTLSDHQFSGSWITTTISTSRFEASISAIASFE